MKQLLKIIICIFLLLSVGWKNNHCVEAKGIRLCDFGAELFIDNLKKQNGGVNGENYIFLNNQIYSSDGRITYWRYQYTPSNGDARSIVDVGVDNSGYVYVVNIYSSEWDSATKELESIEDVIVGRD